MNKSVVTSNRMTSRSSLSLFFIAGVMVMVGCSDGASNSAGATNSADATNSAGAAASGNRSGQPEKTVKPIAVEVVLPQIGTAASHYVTTATLAPNSDANINARSSGVVREILGEEGDDVKKGAVLLLLEDDDQKIRLNQAQYRLVSAEREFNRLNRMKKSGLASPTEWEAANTAFLSAQTDVALAELALSYTRITAPFEGRVVWREVDRGTHVASGDLLMRIMSIKPLLARVPVPASRLGQLAKGQLVELNAESAKQNLTGVIDLVSPIVDPLTGTIKITVKLTNYPKSVRPGDFVEVSMITERRENALLLPSESIIEERGQHYLFIEQDNIAVRKAIEVGFVVGAQTEVLHGISSQDKVVNKGQRNLKPGNPLQVIVANTQSDQSHSEPSAVNQGKDSAATNLPGGTQ